MAILISYANIFNRSHQNYYNPMTFRSDVNYNWIIFFCIKLNFGCIQVVIWNCGQHNPSEKYGKCRPISDVKLRISIIAIR